jgi:hypothetical protein
LLLRAQAEQNMPKHQHNRLPESNTPVVAMAWYRADQWDQLRRVSADRANLEDTYEEWRVGAEKAERQLRREGMPVLCVLIDVDSLAAWCETRKMEVDGASRSQYAAEMARIANLRRE